ncbi:uncharacterized protein LOC110990895 [Acanthaster planci]|uniref:Uncharacterized protein LOC110990895 n=1 Tax=Acanthaster planci TaxID=133434 RepID=A0A8B8A1V8_ACAPL|nr:uncharacterized protein LOC110990895 [Acanthaster planci]
MRRSSRKRVKIFYHGSANVTPQSRNMNPLVTFTNFTILLSCFAGLNALTCHSCYSVPNSDCADPSTGSYSGNYSTTCGSDDNACSKTVGKLDGSVTITTRSCSSSCDEKCVSLAENAENCEYCCTTDNCNGASALTFSLATVAATILGALAAHDV